MTNTHIKKEIEKIIPAFARPLNLAMSSAWILGHFKGINLKILHMSNKSILGDYFVIGSSTNTTQAKAMAEEIRQQLRPYNQKNIIIEGIGSAEWILIDMGNVMVHIFQESSRELFDLDGLWHGAPQIEIPQEYYFSSSSQETVTTISEDDKGQGYF